MNQFRQLLDALKQASLEATKNFYSDPPTLSSVISSAELVEMYSNFMEFQKQVKQ